MQESRDGSRENLGRLLSKYMPAMKTYLTLTMRIRAQDAEEILSDFVSDKVLEQDILKQADQGRGKFRCFLRTALQNYVISDIRRRAARKRSPEHGNILSLDRDPNMARADDQSSQQFDIAWGREVIAETLRRMQQECESGGRSDIWQIFCLRVRDPILEGAEPPSYGDLARRFDFQSPTQESNILITAKRMFERLLRSVIGEYADSEEEVEAEIKDLKSVFGAGEA